MEIIDIDPTDPFTRCFARAAQLPNEDDYRLQLARRYSYVLPEPFLLDVVSHYSPLVEVGAGSGYWAYMLQLRGADVIAYDQAPPGSEPDNRYHPGIVPWTDVVPGDARVARAHSDRTLFVCWPPAFSALWEVLSFYRGELVIYVGDQHPRTARLAGLREHFERIEVHPVIAMDPLPDRPGQLSVWRRLKS
jgi:hypothetical protein